MPLLTFDPAGFGRDFGRRPFAVRHALADHPLFAPERLLELARALPASHVEYNAGDLPVGLDPALTPRNGLSVEETVRRIEQCRSWMVLKNVEADPAYAALLAECLAEVAATGHPATRGMRRTEAFLFLSSPGSVTPYHLDPEQNFLLQIRGLKTMTVFDGEDRTLLPDEELERYFSGGHRNLTWKEEFAPRGTVFAMAPGDGVHVPVTAPHWVQNGPEVSVSFSITFQTAATAGRAVVHRVNAILRGRGFRPVSAGRQPWRDRLKAIGYGAFRAMRRTLGR